MHIKIPRCLPSVWFCHQTNSFLEPESGCTISCCCYYLLQITMSLSLTSKSHAKQKLILLNQNEHIWQQNPEMKTERSFQSWLIRITKIFYSLTLYTSFFLSIFHSCFLTFSHALPLTRSLYHSNWIKEIEMCTSDLIILCPFRISRWRRICARHICA